MARTGPGAVLALAVLVGCAGGTPPDGTRADLERLLPLPIDMPGWVTAEGPSEHSTDTLYEYLDGGADRFLAHGFLRLMHVRYQLGNDPLTSVTLDLYDMGSDLGAFGIFSAGRSAETEARDWGAGGYRVGTIATCWKGRVFVHGEADDDRPDLVGRLEQLVAGACAAAPGDPTAPAILDPLPTTGRVPHTERWVPADLLGHAFLPGGVLATYEIDAGSGVLFFSDLGTGPAAAAALTALREHLSRWGTVQEDAPPFASDGFRFTDPTLGSGAAVRVGRWVAGIHGTLTVEADDEVLGELVGALP